MFICLASKPVSRKTMLSQSRSWLMVASQATSSNSCVIALDGENSLTPSHRNRLCGGKGVKRAIALHNVTNLQLR